MKRTKKWTEIPVASDGIQRWLQSHVLQHDDHQYVIIIVVDDGAKMGGLSEDEERFLQAHGSIWRSSIYLVPKPGPRAQEDLWAELSDYWGDPDIKKLPKWPSYAAEAAALLGFGQIVYQGRGIDSESAIDDAIANAERHIIPDIKRYKQISLSGRDRGLWRQMIS